jgi:HEAT repeat protein
MSLQDKATDTAAPEEKSFFSVIVHSFFIIPFLIAVFCLLLFVAVNLLTRENRSVFDYLEDVKTGSLNKRWQAAFELSKILANPKFVPTDARFSSEILAAFEKSKHDDPRIRQYLALAMGRMGNIEFAKTLQAAVKEDKIENWPALIYALGMIKDSSSINVLVPLVEHTDARIRSLSVVSLGNLGTPQAVKTLQKALWDREPNVQWGAALSLAQLQDDSGKEILLKLLDRNYLSQFPEVDPEEKNNLILTTIQTVSVLKDPEIAERIKNLSETDPSMKVRSAALKFLSH